MRGGIKYGGVAQSSDEYTLLILRINNIDELGRVVGWHRVWLPINAIMQYEEDSTVIGDLTAGANCWLRSCGYNHGIVAKVEKDIFKEDTLVSYTKYIELNMFSHVRRQEKEKKLQQELRDTIVRRHGNRNKTFWCTAQCEC
jgi:hypothetical protein